ncbi:MAG TPA: EAL domain-containing protein [Steroidobacteraceae bacterium]
MALRTRIALTFLLLLTAVMAAALYAVSAANRQNAERDVQRQLQVGESVFTRLLESNRRLLAQAAQAVADDYGFREAVAARDTDTLKSALENGGARIGAAIIVLTSLDGRVLAAVGSPFAPGSPLPFAAEQRGGMAADHATRLILADGRIYQLVTVNVRSPLPVARITMGFELNQQAAREFADISGLGVTLAVHQGDQWTDVVSTVPAGYTRQNDVATRRIDMWNLGNAKIVAILSRSLSDARAPFEHLTRTLFSIAIVSLLGFAAATFWIARNITRPLFDLTKSVEQIRKGDYAVPLTVERHDELGELAECLQLMQTAVQTRDKSIRQLAYEDTLTGLMNRTAFGAALSTALAQGEGGIVSVGVINLHRFRRINEHLGYSVGDEVLRTIAARLAAIPSIRSAVARLTADQFAVFARLPTADDLHNWGVSLLSELADPVLVELQPIDISATLGVATPRGGALDADDLMRCADLAVERARREKRPLAVYENSLQPAARYQLSLLGELRHALEHDELRLFFQPKMDLATAEVSGAEVLLRWQHPTRGLLAPAAFIPFAEQTGFIRRMTRWTLDRAIAQGGRWHRAGVPLSLAVNISADDLADQRLDSRVAALLTRHQLPPSLLTLELTESGFIENPDQALRMLEAISILGVKLSIDDFGTGYSSLSLLARMPVHEVKIDQSFVRGFESHPEYAAVVHSAIDMGHRLGLKVVAEGIETTTAADRLRSFNCDIGQGYLYAKPTPLDAFEKWMLSQKRAQISATPVNFDAQDLTDTVVF